MDTAPGSIDESDELERLRERAYGPDADIAQDAAAQARLSELEAARRTPVAPEVPGVSATRPSDPLSRVSAGPIPSTTSEHAPRAEASDLPPRPVGAPTGGSPTSTSAAAVVGAPALVGAVPATGAGAAPWWRRRRWLAILGGGIAALVLVVSVVNSLAPRPDFVLRLQGSAGDEQEITDLNGSITWLGLDSDQLLSFEDFRGFRVWSGATRYGTECLMISRVDEGLAALGCSPAGLATIADLQRYSGVTDEVFADMPTGSMIRFVLNGDRVDVFLGEAEPTTS